MSKYYKRLIEEQIQAKLRSAGAVLVAGPKFCGKTTTCMLFQKSYVKLNTRQRIELMRINPQSALKGEKPHLIDEWQTIPDIWNYVKDDLDSDYQFGKYILTGSSTPADTSDIYHSGAGRIVPLKMRTMSLYESEESKGLVSISGLFEGKEYNLAETNEDYTLEDTAYLTCRGGWPISVQEDKELGLEITRNYYDSLFVFEDSKNEQFRNRKSDVLKAVLRSVARNISTEAPHSTILADVKQSENRSLDRKTYDLYYQALKDLYIVEDMEAWNPNIRSKTSVRSTPTRHFVDPSIACRAINISPGDLMKDLETFGLFFEDLAVRDLNIYMSVTGGEVRHYRDNAGLECDAVLHNKDGSWGAVEIKLGGERLVEEGVKSLNTLEKKIREKSDEKAPVFKMVVTATGPAYRRNEDGIYVVPINCLMP